MKDETRLMTLYLSKFYPFIIGTSFHYVDGMKFINVHISYSKFIETFPHIEFYDYKKYFLPGDRYYMLVTMIDKQEHYDQYRKEMRDLSEDIFNTIKNLERSNLFPIDKGENGLNKGAYIIYE